MDNPMLNTIQTPADLNKFVALFSSLRPEDIPAALCEYKIVVSPSVAAIISEKITPMNHDSHETHIYSRPTF